MKIKINNQIKIKQVYEAVGGPYGSIEINKEIFKKIITSFFGEDVYENILNWSTVEEYRFI